MDYKTLKKEINKIAKPYNLVVTFGEKKQFEKGCFLVSNYGFVKNSDVNVEVESEIPSNSNWVLKSKGYWLRDENGRATEYRDVIHWECREYSIVDVKKLFGHFGKVVLENAESYNSSKYGKHDLLKTYRIYFSDDYLN